MGMTRTRILSTLQVYSQHHHHQHQFCVAGLEVSGEEDEGNPEGHGHCRQHQQNQENLLVGGSMVYMLSCFVEG